MEEEKSKKTKTRVLSRKTKTVPIKTDSFNKKANILLEKEELLQLSKKCKKILKFNE